MNKILFITVNYQNTEVTKNFVKFFLDLRREQKIISSRSDVLFLKFEDLIFNYDHEILKINKFIGRSEKIHSLNKKIFDPTKSCRNVGKFKAITNEWKIAIKYIEDKLTDFLYLSS